METTGKKMKHIVSFSGGKESTAMLLRMLELKMQVDEIMYCDNGLEYPEVYDYVKKIEKFIGRKITVIKPKKSWDDLFFQNRLREKERVSKFMTEFQNRPEEKEASRKRNTGIKNPAFGVHRFGKDAPMFGKHQSDYQKRRVSEVHTGKIVSEKTKKEQRISAFEYAKRTNNILYPRIGKHEKQILDELELYLSHKILRQFRVEGYFIDGYIPKLNIVIEVDEQLKNKVKDIERQKIIENKLKCKFIRINDFGLRGN